MHEKKKKETKQISSNLQTVPLKQKFPKKVKNESFRRKYFIASESCET